MDILIDQYLPFDDVINIAHKIDPEAIIPFCKINKLTNNICQTLDFWIKYINNDQIKYNKLMQELAKYGRFKLFNDLWGTAVIGANTSIISEPYILIPAFENAYIKGYELMAKHLLRLYLLWTPMSEKYYAFLNVKEISTPFELKFLGVNVINFIKKLYNRWHDVEILASNFESEWTKRTWALLLRKLAITGEIDEAVALYKNYFPRDVHDIEKANQTENLNDLCNELSYCRNFTELNKFLSGIFLPNYKVYYPMWKILIKSSVVNNMPLAQEILGQYKSQRTADNYLAMCKSNSPDALKLFIENVKPNDMEQFLEEPAIMSNGIRPPYYGYECDSDIALYNITNREIALYLLHNFGGHHILKFVDCFEAEELIGIINQNFKCISKHQHMNIVHYIFGSGQLSKLIPFLQNVMICDMPDWDL